MEGIVVDIINVTTYEMNISLKKYRIEHGTTTFLISDDLIEDIIFFHLYFDYLSLCECSV